MTNNWIQELKKNKLLDILNNLPPHLKIKSGRPLKKSSSYRSIYLRYLWWKKRYPQELPDFKVIWTSNFHFPNKDETTITNFKTKKRTKFWDLGGGKSENFHN